MTTPGAAIKDEVRVLIDIQIETFGRPAPLTPSQLREFHDRSETIRMLCQELNQIRARGCYGTTVREGLLARVSEQP